MAQIRMRGWGLAGHDRNLWPAELRCLLHNHRYCVIVQRSATVSQIASSRIVREGVIHACPASVSYETPTLAT